MLTLLPMNQSSIQLLRFFHPFFPLLPLLVSLFVQLLEDPVLLFAVLFGEKAVRFFRILKRFYVTWISPEIDQIARVNAVTWPWRRSQNRFELIHPHLHPSIRLITLLLTGKCIGETGRIDLNLLWQDPRYFFVVELYAPLESKFLGFFWWCCLPLMSSEE